MALPKEQKVLVDVFGLYTIDNTAVIFEGHYLLSL